MSVQPSMTVRRALLALAVIAATAFGGAAGARPRGAEKPTVPSGSTCAGIADGTRTVSAIWGAPRSTQGCFFFAGPGQLGRDDQHGAQARWSRRGNVVELALGSAVFTGGISGDRVRLTRRSDHQHGTRWVATEVIQGRVRTNPRAECQEIDATYTYSECDTTNRAECPGTCRIAAPLTLR